MIHLTLVNCSLMKNKKSVYILLSVAALCLVGLAVSSIIDWPVDSDKAVGNFRLLAMLT